MSEPKVKRAKLADLSPDERNANRGTERGRAVVRESVQRHGAGRSILVDRRGRIIAGNKAHGTAVASNYSGWCQVLVLGLVNAW